MITFQFFDEKFLSFDFTLAKKNILLSTKSSQLWGVDLFYRCYFWPFIATMVSLPVPTKQPAPPHISALEFVSGHKRNVDPPPTPLPILGRSGKEIAVKDIEKREGKENRRERE